MIQSGSAATEKDPPKDAKKRERFRMTGQKSGHQFFTDSPMILGGVKIAFDFAVAQSIFSHCGLDLIVPWLSSIAKSLSATGRSDR
jgi:hypothetical protein